MDGAKGKKADRVESQDDRPEIKYGDKFFPCSSCDERKSCRVSCHKWKYYLGKE